MELGQDREGERRARRPPLLLPQSEHRTLDIEEADLLYVPVYVNMLVWPVYGWADGPWWHSVFGAGINPY